MGFYFIYKNGYDREEMKSAIVNMGYEERTIEGFSAVNYCMGETVINLTSAKEGNIQIQQGADVPSREELSGLIDRLKPNRVVDAGLNDVDLDEWFD